MIVRAQCQECKVIYIKSKTSHPGVCGNCTCKRPVKVIKHHYPDQENDECMEVKEKDLSKPVIKSGNRYKSKVDWSSDRVRNQVQGLLDHGRSLSYIARHLGVSRSTLTMANKRHNYRLYIPDISKAG